MTRSSFHRFYFLALVLPVLTGAFTVEAQYISIRVSVKFILSTNGQPASGSYDSVNQWRQAIDNANAGNARLGRGFRYEYPTFDGNVSGYARYFDLDDTEPVPFEYSIRTNAAQSGWRANALNVYIVNRNLGTVANPSCAGWASNPEDDLSSSAPFNTMKGRVVVLCANVQGAPGSALSIVSHEFGHHLGLIHTWANDRVADTVVDADPGSCEQAGVPDWCGCKFSNTLARAAAQGWSPAVLRTATNNLMSYHCENDTDFDLTEGQLDRWADLARRYLASEMTGVTYFVDRTASSAGNGYSASPYKTVLAGIAAATATGGNLVIVRPGSYNEQITIDKPVTLRVTRQGPATIGRP